MDRCGVPLPRLCAALQDRRLCFLEPHDEEERRETSAEFDLLNKTDEMSEEEKTATTEEPRQATSAEDPPKEEESTATFEPVVRQCDLTLLCSS